MAQNSDAVINMKLFLNVFWNYRKGWRLEVKENSKKKSLWSIFVRLWLNIFKKSGWKIKHKVPYRGKVTNFSWNFVTFSRLEFSPTNVVPNEKFFLMENFTCETHFSKCTLKLKNRQPFRNDIPIVNMVED